MKTMFNDIVANVFSTLNEKAGIIEFDNIAYRKEVVDISKKIKSARIYNDNLKLDNNISYKFAKFTFEMKSLSWLETLNVYYRKDIFVDAGALIDEMSKEKGLFILEGNSIKVGTIYIIDNEVYNVTHLLFHEICHLYDNSKFKKIWMEDESYFLKNQNTYDITKYNYDDNVNNYNVSDIHNIIIESTRFANFTESHAYLENINFEMFEHLNNKNIVDYLYVDKEMAFAKSSPILWDIYNLEKIVSNLRYINDNTKNEYMSKYKSEIEKAYYNFNTYNKLINYIYKKLHKIIQHSRTLFNYYYNLDSSAKWIYELDESTKDFIINRDHFISNKRKL